MTIAYVVLKLKVGQIDPPPGVTGSRNSPGGIGLRARGRGSRPKQPKFVKWYKNLVTMAPNGKPSEDVYFDKVATFNNYIWSQLVHTFVSFITRDNPEVFSQFHPIKQHPQSCFHNPQPFQTQISTLNMQIQIHIIRIWLKFSNI